MQEEQILTAREAHAFLKVSRATFDRLRLRSTFPQPVRLGRRRCLRWRRSELVGFLASAQRSGSCAEARER